MVRRIEGIDVRWHRLVGGRPPRCLGFFRPADPDSLLDECTEEEFHASDQRMPYFGTLWPAAESLALEVMEGGELAGLRVLDLGCGIGAVGLAAARRGARVTFLDWEPRALECVKLSARAQGLRYEAALTCDWRRPGDLGKFDRIYGADVLYEERNGPAVAAFLARHLAPRGEAHIADPGRKHALPFPAEAARHGLHRISHHLLPPREHLVDVELHRLRLSLGAPAA